VVDSQIPDDAPVCLDEIYAMLRGMIIQQIILKDSVRVGMESAQFNGPGEMLAFYTFAALRNLIGAHATVTEEMLLTELRAWYAANAIPVSEAEFLELQKFIANAFGAPPLDAQAARSERQYVEKIVRRFINTRMIKRGVQSVLTNSDTNPNTAAGGLDEKLNRWTKAAQAVKFIGRPIVSGALMPEWGSPIQLPPAPEVTSLPWVDKYIGGFRAGDVIGLLGPTSGGKSTLMAIAATRMAQNYSARGENKLAIFIGYEDGAEKTNHLFWSAAAHIDRNLLVSGADFWANCSTKDNPKEYDKRLPENRNGRIVTGEKERWILTRPWLDKHFVFLDFSAAGATGYGSGGVAEISAVLSALSEARGMEIGFVAIDYAVLLINRELSNDRRTKNLEQIWRQVQQLPDDLRTRVAVPTGCSIMLAHQLAGSDIKKIPAYRYVTHFDAQGSKAFAENVHACLCINHRDPETRVSTINWSKIRAAVPATPFGLIRLDDTIVDAHLVNDDYVASESSRRIIKKNEAGLVLPDDPTTRRKNRFGDGGVDTFGSDL